MFVFLPQEITAPRVSFLVDTGPDLGHLFLNYLQEGKKNKKR